MKGIFLTGDKKNIDRAYGAESRAIIRKKYELEDRIFNREEVIKNMSNMADVEAIFTTWGMESMTAEEIQKIFPNLKYIYYAAGSVQHFARPFLECGVRVFSAFRSNAIPVSEYVFANILLANKGYFACRRKMKFNRWAAVTEVDRYTGNYRPNIGIIGVGTIGKLVVEKCKTIDCKIYAYDPFLSLDYARENNIQLVSLEELFEESDVITNHLANKEELNGILDYALFSRMKPRATFINSGRGAQVDEQGLVRAMREVSTRTAILDVTYPEPPHILSRLRHCGNIILTPHIAGSLGGEVKRMGMEMAATVTRISDGIETDNEVTLEKLATMA